MAREGDPSLQSLSEKLDRFLTIAQESKEEREQLLKAIWDVNTTLAKMKVRLDGYVADTLALKKVTTDLQLKQARILERIDDIGRHETLKHDMSVAMMSGTGTVIAKWILYALLGGLFVWLTVMRGHL